jgi:hypothetical protein
MKTRNGLMYSVAEAKTENLAPPFPKVETDEFCTTFSKSCLAPPFPKVETDEFCTTFSKSCLAPPFPKVEVDFDEASTAWKLNKKSIGNGCYKYVCVKIKKTGTQCKNDSIKNCEYCKFHSTFRKGGKGGINPIHK